MFSRSLRGRARQFNGSNNEGANNGDSDDDWGWNGTSDSAPPPNNRYEPVDTPCTDRFHNDDESHNSFRGRGNFRGLGRGGRGDSSTYNRSGRGESHGYSRGREDQGYSRGREDQGYSRGREGQGYSRGRAGQGYSRGREDQGYSRGRESIDNGNSDNADKIEMFVPKSCCGRIIGKAGSKIMELQNESGANIKVNSQTDGEEASIVLTGTPNQCSTAKKLIQEVVADSSRPYNRDRESFPRSNGYQVNGPDTTEASSSTGQSSRGSRGRGGTSRGGYQGGSCADDDNVEPTSQMMGKIKLESRRITEEKDQEFYPVVKSFYKPVSEVANMSKEERNEIFKNSNNILVKEFNGTEETEENSIPNPVTKFEHAFGDYPAILEELNKQSFVKPSPIQSMSWPVILSGRDFIGIAQTGSGKTLAFLLPAFIHIEGQQKPRHLRMGPTVLVLSPTRELALQIMSEVKKYSFRDIRCVCIYGGGEKRKQLNELNEDPEIVVATPGRLNDLLDSNQINLADVSYLVLDEADRMLDMGFEPQVVKTLWGVRKERQTVMTSATWPASVHRIAKTYMQSPIQVNVGSYDLNACHDVVQRIEMCHPDDKRDRLLRFVSKEITRDDKILVFVGKKADCSYLCADIQTTENAPSATCIHGDLDQDSREDALESLREGYVQILVATDLASRGIDIKDITYVFNYDFPRNIEEYVHRVGRTGRAGRKGVAISLMTRSDGRHAEELIEILEEAKQIIPDELISLKDFHETRQKEDRGNRFRGGGRGRGRGPRY